MTFSTGTTSGIIVLIFRPQRLPRGNQAFHNIKWFLPCLRSIFTDEGAYYSLDEIWNWFDEFWWHWQRRSNFVHNIPGLRITCSGVRKKGNGATGGRTVWLSHCVITTLWNWGQ